MDFDGLRATASEDVKHDLKQESRKRAVVASLLDPRLLRTISAQDGREVIQDERPIKVTVRRNVAQIFLEVDEELAHRCVRDGIAQMRKGEWATPAFALIGFLTTLTTAEFNRSFIGLNGSEWKAIFVVSSIVTGGWLLRAVWTTLNSKAPADVVKNIMEEMSGLPPTGKTTWERMYHALIQPVHIPFWSGKRRSSRSSAHA